MKKFILFAIPAGLLIWFGGKLFQNPEKYLKKQTQKLIALADKKGLESDLSLISRVSQMDKYIHFDVHLKAEYEGQTYKAKSLNEFRSLLLSYLRQKTTGNLDYKNLIAKVEENKKQGQVNFEAFFERGQKNVSCKVLLRWIKEKKWYIKKIELFSCAESSAFVSSLNAQSVVKKPFPSLSLIPGKSSSL